MLRSLICLLYTSTRTLNLRFMHGQSYGYNAYFEGDTVAFVKASTMERFASAQVVAVKRLTDRIVQVTFNRDIPGELELNHDFVETVSYTHLDVYKRQLLCLG